MFVDIEKIQPRNEKVNNGHAIVKFDLLEIPSFKKLIKWNGFPLSFQIMILFILTGLIFQSWGKYTPANEDPELYARLNLVSLLVWCIWWPAIIISVIILGRIWCMVCPLELVSRLGGKLGAFLKIPRFQLKGTMRNGTIILMLYFIIQMLVPGIGLHEVPAYSAFFFTGLIFLAAVSGLFYKNGSFCKAFCPVSFTLNAYSRGGMLAVRAATRRKCSACSDKSCIRIENKGISAPRSCPGNLYLPRMQNSQDCLLCGQCIKSCPSDNVEFLLRPPFSINDVREKTASVCMTLFIMIESGFVIGELAEEWPAAEKIFMYLPGLLINSLDLNYIPGWIMGLWSLIFFPLIIWSVFSL
ncbi:MAG: 4Fe-4S binding protein, partial [Syntrophothermus sp.]